MAYTHSATITTTADPQSVFRFACNVERRSDWILAVQSAQLLTSPPVEVGSRFEEVGGRATIVLEFTEVEPHTRVGYASVGSNSVDVLALWEFKPVSAGTDVTLTLTLEPHGLLAILFPILFPLVIRPTMRRDIGMLEAELSPPDSPVRPAEAPRRRDESSAE